jgi:serine/threonine-protein kinase
MTQTMDWRALSAALDEALGLGTEAREPWLLALENRDPPLATRVRSLLQQRDHMAARGFLEGVAHQGLTPLHTPALVGARIGPYVIEAEAGRGGMGSVWRARRDDGHFEGTVAIKFLNLAALDLQGERRFRREGVLLGKLDHPNVARLLDAGVQPETHQPYLVLEYVDGVPIDTYCEQQALDLAARVRLFIDVLHAVSHAHSHLVIHGDIKPSNILVTRAGVVKLLDFGIARLADDESDQTRSSVSALTPQYAAPEQILGEFVTTRTDIYCLGLVLYRLLTGHHAVQNMERGRGALLAEILERDPPAPSSLRDIHTLRRQQFAGDLDNIVAKAYRKSAAERYQSAGAFVDDLQRYLRHEPVTARRDTLPYRVGKFVRRHRGSVAASLVTAVALVLATAITSTQMVEARHQRDTALLESRRADASADFLQLMLAENRPRAQPLTMDELLDRGAELLELQYGGNRRFVAEMYMLLASERGGRNEYDKANYLLERASASARQADDTALRLRAECTLVFNEADQGMEDAARARLARSGWNRAISNGAWETEVQCLRAEANLTPTDTGGYRESLALLERARARIEMAGMTHDRSYTSVISYLAVVHRALGDLPRALELVREGGRMHEQNGRGGTRSRLLALNNEAVILWDMGEIAGSHALRRNIEERMALIDPRGMEMFNTNLAGSLIRLEQYDAARAALAGAADKARARGDLVNEIGARLREVSLLQQTSAPLVELDAALARVGQLMADPARKIPNKERYDYQEALARREITGGQAAAALARMQASLAQSEGQGARRYLYRALWVSSEAALAAEDAASARRFARRGASIAREFARGDDSSADVGELLLLEARATEMLGDAGARTLYERALRCFTNGYGAQHPRTLAVRRTLEQPFTRHVRAD